MLATPVLRISSAAKKNTISNYSAPSKRRIPGRTRLTKATRRPVSRSDWQAQHVTCPQGKASALWRPYQNKHGRECIAVRFAHRDCLDCTVHSQCTHSPGPRTPHPVAPELSMWPCSRRANIRRQKPSSNATVNGLVLKEPSPKEREPLISGEHVTSAWARHACSIYLPQRPST